MDEWGELEASGSGAGSGLIVMDMLTENMNVVKKCGTGGGCFYDGTYKTLGSVNEAFSGTAGNFTKVLLSDGTAIAFWVNPNSIIFFVDVDGASGENTTGKDAFWFVLDKNGVYPAGIDNRFGRIENCLKPIAAYGTSRGCAAWVIYKENMDYLHCDDLSWTGKSRCK